MIMACDTDPGNHEAHASGLAALLQIENSPLVLLDSVRSGWSLLNSKVQVSSSRGSCVYCLMFATSSLDYSQCHVHAVAVRIWMVCY